MIHKKYSHKTRSTTQCKLRKSGTVIKPQTHTHDQIIFKWFISFQLTTINAKLKTLECHLKWGGGAIGEQSMVWLGARTPCPHPHGYATEYQTYSILFLKLCWLIWPIDPLWHASPMNIKSRFQFYPFASILFHNNYLIFIYINFLKCYFTTIYFIFIYPNI